MPSFHKRYFPFFLRLPCIALLTYASTDVNYCPLLGPVFPIPAHLPSDQAFISACNDISMSLNQAFNSENLSSVSISLQIFDSSHDAPLFRFSHTSDFIDTTLGVGRVDEDTVFRIGSLSKVWTVLLILIEGGLASFQDKIANYIPELRAAVFDLHHNATKREDQIDFVQWDEVTVGELASQLAGIARDYGILDLTEQAPLLEQMGFPVLPEAEVPSCGAPRPCNRTQFFNGILESHPTVPTSSTPVYSNAAFQILGYALEAIAGQDFQNILCENLIRPLGLTRTFYDTPNTRLGVIPEYLGEFFWNFELGDEAPAGGFYASTKDVVTVGRAILKHDLIAPAVTRRWLKPATFASSLGHAVGAPWEILSFNNFRVIDVYTKAGDLGVYSSMLALSPAHGVGFTILAAGNDSHSVIASLSDLIASTIFPALDESAKKEAHDRFAGTYSLTHGINSSITISAGDGPGLEITRWISNSTDMFRSLAALSGVADSSLLNIRLYPTGLESPKQISFRAIVHQLSGPEANGPFTGACTTWQLVDSQVYGNIGIDEFVFGLNQKGDAISVSPRALRLSMPKV